MKKGRQTSGEFDKFLLGFTSQLELRHGLPVQKITRSSVREGIDLLVNGYGEQSGFNKLIHDKVSLDIVDREPCPVIVVRQRNHSEGNL